MDCNRMKPLVPLYLDGELTEARAAPLRQHLLGCPRCRSVAQGETALKGWFASDEAVTVPVGFAARVARRAFAGDVASAGGAAASVADPRPEPREAPLMQFLLHATAIAATLLIALSIGMHRANVPEITDLQADDSGSLSRVLEDLDGLNQQNAGPDAALSATEDQGTESAQPEKGKKAK